MSSPRNGSSVASNGTWNGDVASGSRRRWAPPATSRTSSADGGWAHHVRPCATRTCSSPAKAHGAGRGSEPAGSGALSPAMIGSRKLRSAPCGRWPRSRRRRRPRPARLRLVPLAGGPSRATLPRPQRRDLRSCGDLRRGDRAGRRRRPLRIRGRAGARPPTSSAGIQGLVVDDLVPDGSRTSRAPSSAAPTTTSSAQCN